MESEVGEGRGVIVVSGIVDDAERFAIGAGSGEGLSTGTDE